MYPLLIISSDFSAKRMELIRGNYMFQLERKKNSFDNKKENNRISQKAQHFFFSLNILGEICDYLLNLKFKILLQLTKIISTQVIGNGYKYKFL